MDLISIWVADAGFFGGCLRDCSDFLEDDGDRPSAVFLELAQLVNRAKPIKKMIVRNTILSNLPAIDELRPVIIHATSRLTPLQLFISIVESCL